MFGNVNMWIGAAAGAALVAIVGWGYNALIENPMIEAAAVKRANLEAENKTLKAINEVTDNAQKARAMRRYCTDNGRLYSFRTGKCLDTRSSPSG